MLSRAMPETRTIVTFKSSAFNTRQIRGHFINPENYGDDLAKWLRQELKGRGVEVGADLGQEDFGWYFDFTVGGRRCSFVLGYRGDDDEGWVGRLERDADFLPSLLGARKRGISPEAAQVIHDTLSTAAQITEVRWHVAKDFEAGREEEGRAEPVPA